MGKVAAAKVSGWSVHGRSGSGVDLLERTGRLNLLGVPAVAGETAPGAEAEPGVERHGRCVLDEHLQQHRPVSPGAGFGDGLLQDAASHSPAPEFRRDTHRGHAAGPAPPGDEQGAGRSAVLRIDAAGIGIEVLATEPALVGLRREDQGNEVAFESPVNGDGHLFGRVVRDGTGGEGWGVHGSE
jgi:hypothetical protein